MPGRPRAPLIRLLPKPFTMAQLVERVLRVLEPQPR
jgi:hypothetical protein